MEKQIDDLIKIERSDFLQIKNRLEEILTSASQVRNGTNQQRIDCLDNIIGWVHGINSYIKTEG